MNARQTHALVVVLSRKGLLTVDELRRSLEGLPAAAYQTLPYYTKWARALTSLALERGILARADIDAALGPLETEDPPVLCAQAHCSDVMEPCREAIAKCITSTQE